MKLQKSKLRRIKLMKLFNWLGHSETKGNLGGQSAIFVNFFMQPMQTYETYASAIPTCYHFNSNKENFDSKLVIQTSKFNLSNKTHIFHILIQTKFKRNNYASLEEMFKQSKNSQQAKNMFAATLQLILTQRKDCKLTQHLVTKITYIFQHH